ncbi:hypothetical protein K502DRAFT_344127 [Neoconidiobolus thromboides FSU 785]|nr:hypothetical protein K502DRAFT_344127 [Neoconidiobolus thromboides FSU 785]
MKGLFSSTLLIAGLLGLLPTAYCVKYKNIIAFGDGFSDFGNYFENNGRQDPDPKFYFKGRTSNGPLWIEYLTKALGSPKLKSFAYHLATCNGKGNYINKAPGANSQVNVLFKKYYEENKERLDKEKNDSLLCYTFTGSEYFLDDIGAEEVVKELETHLKEALRLYPVKDVLIPISTNVDSLEVTKEYSSLKTITPSIFKSDFKESWTFAIENLKDEFPDINFIEYDYDLFWNRLSSTPAEDGNGKLFITDKPCLTTDSDGHKTKCDDPSKFALYDPFYPTTEVHKLIAKDVLKYLKAGTNPYANMYY